MLPIGSIVFLKDGTSKIMILNREPLFDGERLGDKGVMYDYSGCLYPQGLDPNKVFYFNEDNIDKVIFEGYKNEEEERFKEIYHKWLEANKSTIEKGTVKGSLI